MIEDTGLRVQNIADSYFPNQTARSRFLEEMQNNMKKYSGIPLYMSNEELSEERNEQNEKDYYEGTEKSLVSGDMSNPVDYNNVISNIDAYAAMERSYPSTVVYAAFTDKEVAESMQTDDAFFINAANTDEDYPVWVTRTNIVNSALLEAMENDEASIFSQVKRVVVPTGLAIGFEAMKSVAGTFLASGLSAAYDTTRLGGQSIYNVQNKYKQRYMDIISNKNLNQEQTLEAARRMFEDLKAEVPEEYRYEIYKGIYERPDPFADFGQAFSGAALEAGWRTLKTSVKGSTGMLRGMKEYSKKSLNKVKHIGQPNQGIEELDMNDELIKKIEDHVNNKVSEETVDAVVEHKAAAKAPKTPEETTPEKEEVVKGIIKEKEIDSNLLLNNNGDHISYEPTGWPISYGKMLHDLGRSGPGLGKRLMTLGEINESGKSIGYVSVIEHGKGVDGNTPFTYEEAQQWLKTEQGPSAGIFRYDQIEPHSIEFDPDNAKPYIQIQTASPDAWSTDPNVRGQFDYEGHHPGENGQAFGGGGYAGVPSSGWSSAEGRYFSQFDRQKLSYYPKEYIKTNDGTLIDTIGYRQDLLGKPNDDFFTNDKKYYEEALKLADPDSSKDLTTPGYNRKYYVDSITDIGMYIKAFKDDENMMEALKLSLDSQDNFLNAYLMNEHSFRNYNVEPSVAIGETLKGNIKSRHDLEEIAKRKTDDLNRSIENVKKDLELYKDFKKKYNFSDKDMFELGDKASEWIENGGYGEDFYKSMNIDIKDMPAYSWDILFELRRQVGEVLFAESFLQRFKKIRPSLEDLINKGFTVEEEHPLNYKTTLNTHIIQNPEKRLDNLLWWDESYGIQPLAYFYKGDKAQAAEDIMYEKISSVNKDVAKGIYNEVQDNGGSITVPHAANKNYIFFPGWSLDKTEQVVAQLYLDMNKYNQDSLGAWEDLMRRYVYDPLPESEKAKYHDFKDWHSKYLTSKGIDITWHHGNPTSPGNNVVVHNTKMFKPVTKVETDIHKYKDWTQYIYDNGHGIYTEDGVNWKGLEVHAPDDAKPVIIKAGKIVDKP